MKKMIDASIPESKVRIVVEVTGIANDRYSGASVLHKAVDTVQYNLTNQSNGTWRVISAEEIAPGAPYTEPEPEEING